MPFAPKFRAMMALPCLGTRSAISWSRASPWGTRAAPRASTPIPWRMVLRGVFLLGAGGRQAGHQSRSFVSAAPPFRAYGTPYHLWFGPAPIEKLDTGRYEITAEGAGARVHLEQDLERFCQHLADQGLLAADANERHALVTAYLDGWRAEIARLVGRYRTKLARHEGG